MANENQSRSDMSIQDIAATLVSGGVPVTDIDTDDEVTLPTGGETDDLDTSEEEEDQDDEPEELSGDEGEEQEDEQSDDDPDDEPEYLDIRDDDVISVMVDGKEQEVTIGDLKKAHSLAGATEGRLQEATETRKTAHAERTQMLEKLAAEEATVTQALTGLDDSVFKPVIPAPTDQLRARDPEQYLRHKEAYDADQQRIAEAKKAVEDRVSEIKKQREGRLAEYAQQAGQVILQEIPELRNEQTAPAMLQKLAETAKVYGYTDQEIQSALDPRMFLLVRDAMKYRTMMDKTRETPDPRNLEGQKAKKVRRIRSGNTQAKTRARTTDKKRKEVVAKAKRSGKPADVAATLLVPKG